MLRRGAGPTKADLYLCDWRGKALVLKDFAAKPRWARWLGRWLIRREARAYRWLEGVPGVPRCYGRAGPYALAIEHVEGIELGRLHLFERDRAQVVRGLAKLVERLHARGFAHLDLRGRENVLVSPQGAVFAVDLAGAFWFRPGTWRHRLLFPLFAFADRAAVVKWKELLAPELLDDADRRLAERFRRLRRLWPFNPKNKPSKEA